MPGAGEPERPAHQRLRVVRLLRLDELEAHFPLLAKKAAAFRRKSRSIVTVFSSRRSRVFSARSSLVSGPCGSFLSSISALFTQARTLVSVSPSSRDTAPTLLPLVRISFITSALYSFVNDLLALAMDSILHHIGGVREIGAGSDPPVLLLARWCDASADVVILSVCRRDAQLHFDVVARRIRIRHACSCTPVCLSAAARRRFPTAGCRPAPWRRRGRPADPRWRRRRSCRWRCR